MAMLILGGWLLLMGGLGVWIGEAQSVEAPVPARPRVVGVTCAYRFDPYDQGLRYVDVIWYPGVVSCPARRGQIGVEVTGEPWDLAERFAAPWAGGLMVWWPDET